VSEGKDNSNLFNQFIKEYITEVTEGYNVSILCYGVTGTGKTHTMFGALNEQFNQPSQIAGGKNENLTIEEQGQRITDFKTEKNKGICYFAIN
jgi:Kinesin motor domain